MRVLCSLHACVWVLLLLEQTKQYRDILCFLLPSHELYQPQKHCSCATCPSIPTSLAMPKTYSASQPSLQRSTGGDLRSLVDCHQKETLHYCRVTDSVHLCLFELSIYISLGLRHLDLLWDLNPSTSDPQSKVLTTMLQGQCKNISCSLFK